MSFLRYSAMLLASLVGCASENDLVTTVDAEQVPQDTAAPAGPGTDVTPNDPPAEMGAVKGRICSPSQH